MVSRTVTVADKAGLHMRPANIFVSRMAEFSSDIILKTENNEIDGKSIMNIMAAGIRCGARLTIICSGKDEAQMLEAAAQLIENGMD